MDFWETFLTAIDSLFANKLRSILTMLGVIIGVAAVIALMAIGNGFSEYVTGEIQAIGTNLIFITTEMDNSGGLPSLTMEDVTALENPVNAPDLAAVAATSQGTLEVTYNGNSERVSVIGVTSNYFAVNNLMESYYMALKPYGIGVSCLCPIGINSNIHEATLTRPEHLKATGYNVTEETMQFEYDAFYSTGIDPVATCLRQEGTRQNLDTPVFP